MYKSLRGAALATTVVGIALGSMCIGTVQAKAPTQTMLAADNLFFAGEDNLELLPNPVLMEKDSKREDDMVVQAYKVENDTKQKLQALSKSRSNREKIEKIERERKLKKMREEKRRKEIKACIGVNMGGSDQKILERIVEAEAGGEDLKGKVLVANVVLNRVKHKSFPDSIKEVVFAHRGSRYQFSPISDGRYYTVNVSESTKRAVEKALRGDDPSKGALYFMQRSYSSSRSTTWFDSALTRLFKYGCHEFFK